MANEEYPLAKLEYDIVVGSNENNAILYSLKESEFSCVYMKNRFIAILLLVTE